MTLTYQKKVCNEVQEICKPLFNLFNINFFSHARAFHNGYFTSLMTQPELTEYYVSQKFPIRFSQGQGIFLENGFYLGASLRDAASDKITNQLQENFNTAHFIYIIDKQKDYDDMYSIATRPENTYVINQYLNNLDVLKHFLCFYKEKSAALIKNATLIKYGDEYFPTSTQHGNHSVINTNYFETMPLKKITLTGNLGEVLISQREFDCLKLIVKGYSFKEIGKNLNISPRTVETYVNNLKDKLGFDKKMQLMELAFSKNTAHLFA